jgi:hypothetical protein
MSPSKSFPALTGSCVCNTIRYRLLTSPLFCYACHCIDCQKTTGSAFYLSATIELYNIQILSPTSPLFIRWETKPGVIDRHAECPQCHVRLWASNSLSEAVVDLRVGTLDYPSLMQPDAHIFVESKLDWVKLPEGAKTAEKGIDMKSTWPESSLKRLEVCLQRAEEVKKRRIAAMKEGKDVASSGEENLAAEGSMEGDKTPTAGEFGAEDDEAFEKRFKETEQALQLRLEKLSLKLKAEELTKMMEKTSIAGTDTAS